MNALLIVAGCAVGALLSAWALVRYVSKRLDQFSSYPELPTLYDERSPWEQDSH